MISVVIPTLDAEATLAATLTALVPAAVDGLVREVIVADGGSRDRTLKIADQSGAEVIEAARGRGVQLKSGAARARSPWLMFLHADTQLEPGWEREVRQHIERIEEGRRTDKAAAFRFLLDDEGWKARSLERAVAARSRMLALPYGDQGLLISRQLYVAIGGYADLPLMEDVDIVRRLGRKRLHIFRSGALTSAARYRQDGYARRVLRNATCIGLYLLRVPVPKIQRLYEPRRASS